MQAENIGLRGGPLEQECRFFLRVPSLWIYYRQSQHTFPHNMFYMRKEEFLFSQTIFEKPTLHRILFSFFRILYGAFHFPYCKSNHLRSLKGMVFLIAAIYTGKSGSLAVETHPYVSVKTSHSSIHSLRYTALEARVASFTHQQQPISGYEKRYSA